MRRWRRCPWSPQQGQGSRRKLSRGFGRQQQQETRRKKLQTPARLFVRLQPPLSQRGSLRRQQQRQWWRSHCRSRQRRLQASSWRCASSVRCCRSSKPVGRKSLSSCRRIGRQRRRQAERRQTTLPLCSDSSWFSSWGMKAAACAANKVARGDHHSKRLSDCAIRPQSKAVTPAQGREDETWIVSICCMAVTWSCP